MIDKLVEELIFMKFDKEVDYFILNNFNIIFCMKFIMLKFLLLEAYLNFFCVVILMRFVMILMQLI